MKKTIYETLNGILHAQADVNKRLKGIEANVKYYGARGDGKTDDISAIQAAVDEVHSKGGGIVYFPAGTYMISKSISIYSYVTLLGAAEYATTIQIMNASAGHVNGNDVSFVGIKNMTMIGLGMDSAGGGGIYLHRTNDDNVYGVDMENVTIKQCAGSGVVISCPIVSYFMNVTCMGLVGSGFSFFQGGTSVVMNNCYAITCTEAGFDFDQMNYTTLISCAAEVNGIGFYMHGNCNNVAMIGCGCEDQIPRNKFPDPVDFQIEGGVGNSIISCYSRNNVANGIVLKGGNPTVMGYRQLGNSNKGMSIDKNCMPCLINNNCSGVVSIDTTDVDIGDYASKYEAGNTSTNIVTGTGMKGLPSNFSGEGIVTTTTIDANNCIQIVRDMNNNSWSRVKKADEWSDWKVNLTQAG